jgi:hypothetical protein
MIVRLLFLCSLGSSRALLAASILEALAGSWYDVWSTLTDDEQDFPASPVQHSAFLLFTLLYHNS